MTLFGGAYDGRRVLLTGHTGFKGSWLALWLTELGASVTGLALDPETTPNHWDLLGLDMADHRADIREEASVSRIVADAKPEIVFHLAAQPLVRRSYRNPLDTWSTNVMGTANLLDACRRTTSVRAVVIVTSDKCYENREWPWGYRETDALGGHDPYSASKAAAELVTDSYRRAFFSAPGSALVASGRAGNVIGGGDWSEDRLIPDLVRAIEQRVPLEIRSPAATRPWQHVLESLSGYLRLGQRLLESHADAVGAWNFGPAVESNCTVSEVLGRLRHHWPEMSWRESAAPQPHEANVLYVDSAKAQRGLSWKPVWSLDETLSRTADWYRAFLSDRTAPSRAQLESYVSAARSGNVAWSAA